MYVFVRYINKLVARLNDHFIKTNRQKTDAEN